MILALCGTREGREIVKRLSLENIPIIATVTTEYGAKLIDESIEVIKDKLDEEKMKTLIKERNIDTILDITHPYAENISKLALKVTNAENIKYIRYERQDSGYSSKDNSLILWADDFYEAAQMAKKFEGNIFLTIGSNQIPIFLKEIEVNRLIARVLPLGKIVKLNEERGFTPDNLIAMKGPFNKEINIQMFKTYGASVIVAKDSGKTGGTEEKIEAAMELGIPIILVKKPKLDYENIYSDMNLLIKDIISKTYN